MALKYGKDRNNLTHEERKVNVQLSFSLNTLTKINK